MFLKIHYWSGLLPFILIFKMLDHKRDQASTYFSYHLHKMSQGEFQGFFSYFLKQFIKGRGYLFHKFMEEFTYHTGLGLMDMRVCVSGGIWLPVQCLYKSIQNLYTSSSQCWQFLPCRKLPILSLFRLARIIHKYYYLFVKTSILSINVTVFIPNIVVSMPFLFFTYAIVAGLSVLSNNSVWFR